MSLEDELRVREVLPRLEIRPPRFSDSIVSGEGRLVAVFLEAANLGRFAALRVVLCSYLISGGAIGHMSGWYSFDDVGR
jgi:hypothetical protein